MNAKAGSLAATMVALSLASCAESVVRDPAPPAPCTPERCPFGGCNVVVNIDAACDAALAAEVLLEDGLEPERAVPGTPFRTLGAIPEGTVGTLYVRSDATLWSARVECEVPGDLGIDLSCDP
ncbi:MAG: hypothetical protein IV100_28715 [Myxococcales bacterium]|nr:hypothetical protein [Myxococcales bacterium]